MSKSKAIAIRLIEQSKIYLEAPGQDHWLYEKWIEDEEKLVAGVSADIQIEALELIHADDHLLARSAIQALACIGTKHDITELPPLAASSNAELSIEARAAISHMLHRSKSIEELLDEVDSKTSILLVRRSLGERTVSRRKTRASRQSSQARGRTWLAKREYPSFLFAALPGLNIRAEEHRPGRPSQLFFTAKRLLSSYESGSTPIVPL